jgi:hypothetical protein
LRRTIERLFARFVADPMEPGLVPRLQETIELVLSLPFQVRLWEAQNTYYRMMREVAGEVKERAERGDAHAQAWLDGFVKLGEQLKVKVQINAAVSA